MCTKSFYSKVLQSVQKNSQNFPTSLSSKGFINFVLYRSHPIYDKAGLYLTNPLQVKSLSHQEVKKKKLVPLPILQ